MDGKDAIRRMSDSFKYIPSKEHYDSFLRAISKYSNLVIEDAFNHTIEHETRMPSIALFVSYCDTFQERLDEEEHQKRKKEEAEAARQVPAFGTSKLGTEVRKIVRAFTFGKLTRRQYDEKLKKLGIDCGLMTWWKSRGDDLDGTCKSAKMGRTIL